MHILATGEECPASLVESVTSASSLSDAFETIRPLAYHADCFVTLVRCKATGDLAVVKSYFRDTITEKRKRQVLLESHVHSKLSHPNVIQFFIGFEDYKHIYLVIEYAESGDLRKQLYGMTEKRIRDFIVQPLLKALIMLHIKGLVHRDIKPDNILIKQNSVKLADFGLVMKSGTLLQLPGMHDRLPSAHAGGTPLYASPEVLAAIFQNQDFHHVIGPQNDIWSLGVMALEAASGFHPFAHSNSNILYSIAHHENLGLPAHLSPDFCSWLKSALNRDPQKRATAQELLNHPWMSKAYGASEGGVFPELGGLTCRQSFSPPQAIILEHQVECWEY